MSSNDDWRKTLLGPIKYKNKQKWSFVKYLVIKKIVIFDQVLQAHFSLLDKTYTQVHNYNRYSFTVQGFIRFLPVAWEI